MKMIGILRKKGILGEDEAALSKSAVGVASNRWLWDEVVIHPDFRCYGICEVLFALVLRKAKAEGVISPGTEIDPKNINTEDLDLLDSKVKTNARRCKAAHLPDSITSQRSSGGRVC